MLLLGDSWSYLEGILPIRRLKVNLKKDILHFWVLIIALKVSRMIMNNYRQNLNWRFKRFHYRWISYQYFNYRCSFNYRNLSFNYQIGLHYLLFILEILLLKLLSKVRDDYFTDRESQWMTWCPWTSWIVWAYQDLLLLLSEISEQMRVLSIKWL